ncbi:MAG: MBL fold metallo-hydrolase [Phormidesmis sp.]
MNSQTEAANCEILVQIDFLKTGYCTHPEAITIRGGQWNSIKFPALFALIHHPTHGNILYDTGYSERFFQETARFPNRIYALLTPVFFQSEDSAAQQLQQRGIAPESIRYIIISHFHADHIGGLGDFPAATFVCAQSAYDAIKNRSGLSALIAGFLPGLLPADFAQRTQFVEASSQVDLSLDPFAVGFDLFGDRSLIAVELPGHATGQLGLLLQDAHQEYFLVADACWSSQAYRELAEPSAIAQLIFSNPSAYRTTLKQLHQLHQQRPDIRIVPTHCNDIFGGDILGSDFLDSDISGSDMPEKEDAK